MSRIYNILNTLINKVQFKVMSQTIGGENTVEGCLNALNSKTELALRPVQLETEYKTNNYVSKTNFDRITAYKVGNLVIVNGNLGLGGNNYLIGGQTIEIGTIKNMGTVLQPAAQAIPLHGYNYMVDISVAADGKIAIYNYGSTLTSNPWVRFNCTLVTSN